MRALIVALAAAGFAIASLPGHAAGEIPVSQSRLEQPGRTADDEPKLKSVIPSKKAARAIDEDAVLTPTGAKVKVKVTRGADEDPQLLKPAGSSRPSAHAIDDDVPLKPAGASSKAAQLIDDDAPLKPTGASSTPVRTLDQNTPLKSFRAASRPGPRPPPETASRNIQQ